MVISLYFVLCGKPLHTKGLGSKKKNPRVANYIMYPCLLWGREGHRDLSAAPKPYVVFFMVASAFSAGDSANDVTEQLCA